jgi:hypothetical protein
MAWSTKGYKEPLLSILYSFYRLKVSTAFKRIQAITILWHAVMTAGEVFSRLGVLPGFWPISLHNLLRATSDEFRS